MQLTIPRLKEHESSSLRLTHQAIQLEHYTGRSNLCFRRRPCPPKSRSFSPLQSDLVRSETPCGYHKSTKTISQRVGGLQCTTRPSDGGPRQHAKDTGGVRTYDRLATCSPRHRYDNACVPPKDSECLRYAVHTRLSRPPTLSDCIPSAIERPSALDRPHTSPMHDAHTHEFPGLHRNIDEIIWCGGSYERSVWLHHQHHQWEGLDQCSMGIIVL